MAAIGSRPMQELHSRSCSALRQGIDGVAGVHKLQVMFESNPKARASMRPGTLYAVCGEGDWIFYGQVTPEKKVGFVRCRDRKLLEVSAVLSSPVMTVISVGHPSIGCALRAGNWKTLGRFPLIAGLSAPRPVVQWPVGTLDVTVWIENAPGWNTRVEDPAIQDMEIMAVWDAQFHVPARLTADFGAEQAPWHVGGPIWRERRLKEEMAARAPDQAWHRLPPDWVPTKVR